MFAWLRPGDLVWNYWVNNYLLGKRPPAFDILFWNSDTTRMTAALHADFIDLAMKNSLTRPGTSPSSACRSTSAGSPSTPTWWPASPTITPWENCYRSAQALRRHDPLRAVHSGHIAALVNPPGNPKGAYHTNDDMTADAKAWLKGADVHQGTWWHRPRAGSTSAAANEAGSQGLGSNRLSVLAEAPGIVFDK